MKKGFTEGHSIRVSVGGEVVGEIKGVNPPKEHLPADSIEMGMFFGSMSAIPLPDAKKVAEQCYGKKAPAPSQPWVDAADLRVFSSGGGITIYAWRDTGVRLTVDDETNEIKDIWED